MTDTGIYGAAVIYGVVSKREACSPGGAQRNPGQTINNRCAFHGVCPPRVTRFALHPGYDGDHVAVTMPRWL
jgi:hypothetical protein